MKKKKDPLLNAMKRIDELNLDLHQSQNTARHHEFLRCKEIGTRRGLITDLGHLHDAIRANANFNERCGNASPETARGRDCKVASVSMDRCADLIQSLIINHTKDYPLPQVGGSDTGQTIFAFNKNIAKDLGINQKKEEVVPRTAEDIAFSAMRHAQTVKHNSND